MTDIETIATAIGAVIVAGWLAMLPWQASALAACLGFWAYGALVMLGVI